MGFPERFLEKNGGLLVEKGYKVAVIEHLERPREKNKRLEEAAKKSLQRGFTFGKQSVKNA